MFKKTILAIGTVSLMILSGCLKKNHLHQNAPTDCKKESTEETKKKNPSHFYSVYDEHLGEFTQQEKAH